MESATNAPDQFAALCLEFDEAAAALSPENLQRSYADRYVAAAGHVRVLIEGRRGVVIQDRINRELRDKRRRNAVLELIDQGQSEEEAESNAAIFIGPKPTSPVPDPASVQPDSDQAAVMRIGIDRVLALAGSVAEPLEPDAGNAGEGGSSEPDAGEGGKS